MVMRADLDLCDGQVEIDRASPSGRSRDRPAQRELDSRDASGVGRRAVGAPAELVPDIRGDDRRMGPGRMGQRRRESRHRSGPARAPRRGSPRAGLTISCVLTSDLVPAISIDRLRLVRAIASSARFEIRSRLVDSGLGARAIRVRRGWS
jgi:hypothetical protein